MVGDRGMITSARVTAIKADPDNQLGWITCLRAPAIAKLAADESVSEILCNCPTRTLDLSWLDFSALLSSQRCVPLLVMVSRNSF
jgi:hypothetical protein